METKFKLKISAIKAHSKGKGEVPSKYGYNTTDLQRICVYAHYYDNETNPFYIGQGRLSRAFNFLNRDNAWKAKVKDINKVHVTILYIDITIAKSIELEKELIAKYGRIDNGTGCLVNGNNGDTAIGQKGNLNYFYDKHLYGKDNGNYGNKYSKNPLSIPVIQIDILGHVVKHWQSAKEAEEKGGFSAANISSCCNKKRYLHKSYQWIFEDEFDANKDYMFVPAKTSPRIYLCLDLYGNYIKTYYNKDELISDGFNPNNVQQVATGHKKSHRNYVFLDFYRLSKEDKQKCIDNNIIEIRD